MLNSCQILFNEYPQQRVINVRLKKNTKNIKENLEENTRTIFDTEASRKYYIKFIIQSKKYVIQFRYL